MPDGTSPHDFRASLDDIYGSTHTSSGPLSSPSSPSHSPVPTGTDRSRRTPTTTNNATRNGPSDRYRRQREHVHSSSSHREIVRLLIDHEYEVGKLRKALYTSFERITAETNRANEAERARTEMLSHFRTLNDSRAKALREAEKASQELKMYQIQYENAQREIHRAQDVLKLLQEQKDDAERSAARSRRIARELNQNRLVTEARAEGRRLGFAAGFRRAQKEIGGIEGPEEADEDAVDGESVDEAMMAMDMRAGGGADEFYHNDHDDIDDQSRRDEPASHRSPPPPPSEPVPFTQPVPQVAPPSRSQTPSVQTYDIRIPANTDSMGNPLQRPPPPIQPPDNYIPQTTEMGFIALPPPSEFASGSRYPNLAPPSPHSPTIKLPPLPLDVPQPPPLNIRSGSPSNLPNPHPKQRNHARRYSVGSGSTSSHISQSDLLKAVPRGDRPQRELSIIREDGNSSRMGTPSHQRSKSMMSQPSQSSIRGGPLPPSAEQDRDVVSGNDRQQFADQMRYPNATTQGVEVWRANHPPPLPPAQAYRDRPPRNIPRPANLTVPALLSSPPAEGNPPGVYGQPLHSVSDSSSTFYNGFGGGSRRTSHSIASSIGKPIAGLLHTLTRSKKEPRESLSEEITINVDPPSGPSSGRTNFQQPLQGEVYLSPRQYGAPLPQSRGTPDLVPTVPNTPEMAPQYWPDQASGGARGEGGRSASRVAPNGPRGPSPSRSPSPNYIPFPNSQTQSQHQAPPPSQHHHQYYSAEYASREPFRPTSKSSLRRVSSPASMASSARVSDAGSGVRLGHRRSASRNGSIGNSGLGLNHGPGSIGGGTPSSVNRALPSNAYAPPVTKSTSAPSTSGAHGLHRVASNASMASQGSYNPETYLDPAYYPPEGGDGGIGQRR